MPIDHRLALYLPPFADTVVPSIPPDLLGPAAALALALVSLFMFVTERVVPGGRLVKAEAAAAAALALAETAIASQKQMASALEGRNQLDQERIRLIQAGLLDGGGVGAHRRARRNAP